MSAELVRVPVPGTDVPMQATMIDGEPFVALKPLCDALGLTVQAQQTKLYQAEWATTTEIVVVAGDGRVRQVVGLHADSIPMWLATISPNKVSNESRPTLIAYQRQAAKALRDYFYRGVAVQSAPMNQIDVLRAALDQIEAAQRDAAEAKEIAQRSEARLDGIEGNHGWFSALGYAKWKGLPTYEKFVRNLGVHAAMIARTHGIEPGRAQHAHYGYVNSLPVWIWDLASEGLGR